MKNIIYIANARIPTEKAHGVQIMKMCEAFARMGAKIELVTPRRFNPIKEDPFHYYNVDEKFKIKRIPCIDLVWSGKVGFFVQAFSFAITSFFYVIFKKTDIVYSRDELPLFFLSFFKDHLYWETHVPKSNFIAKRVVKKTNGIVSITQGLKDFHIKTYGLANKKILVAPDGVDLADFEKEVSKKELRDKFRLPQNKKIVSYIGKYKTMGIGKGVDNLVKSFPSVMEASPRAFLMLVGINNDEIPELAEIMKHAGLEDKDYMIVPHVSRKDISSYLKLSDVLIMSYPNLEHYAKYMSPLKLFEYMASGIPIVSSDLPSIREVLNESNSVLVDLEDSSSLSDGIVKVLNDERLAHRISHQSLSDIKGYTWESRARSIMIFAEENEQQ